MTEKLKKIKWINIVLFFSLALNFFVAGYYASDSKLLNKFHSKQTRHKRPEIRIVDYFPREEKREFRRLMAKQRKKYMPAKAGIFQRQKEVLQIIAAREVDEKELRQAFRNYQNSNDHLQTAINETVVEMILKMDYQTRTAIVERGQRAHERRNSRHNNMRQHLGDRSMKTGDAHHAGRPRAAKTEL